MLVSEAMTSGPVTVRAEEPVSGCAGVMVRLRIRHLPVVDADGALVGVVTDHAVFRLGGFVDTAWLSFEPEYDDLRAKDVAERPEVVVPADADLDAVLRQLPRSPQDFAVAVDERGHPVGLLTEHDVVAAALALIPGDRPAVGEGTAPVLAVARRRPAEQALELMRAKRVRHLVVTDDDGVIFGVLSYGDLVADDAARRPELMCEDVVRSLMVRTASPGSSLREVAEILHADQIGCVPIVDDERRPVAIVTRRDVLEAAVSALESEELF